jgi:prepilin-type N-terminal cleavage/methylation domain-containing protein
MPPPFISQHPWVVFFERGLLSFGNSLFIWKAWICFVFLYNLLESVSMCDFLSKKAGFSLLELSIVVVIISLLIAGITAGTDVLQSAKVGTTVKQLKALEVAAVSFREKYSAYPGDFKNAHRYFDDGTDYPCGTDIECNGDGNSKIEFGTKYNESEVFRALQHLELASLVKGDFSGSWGDEKSVMAAKLDANFTIQYDEELKKNIVKLGKAVSEIYVADGGAFTTELAEDMDLKIDDGNPLKGEVRGFEGFLGDSKTDSSNYETECIDERARDYNLTYKEFTPCALGFVVK